MAHTVSPVLAELQAAVTKAVGINNSAIALITGFAARQQVAIDLALENGATEAELAPVQDEVDALTASADGLAQAVATNP